MTDQSAPASILVKQQLSKMVEAERTFEKQLEEFAGFHDDDAEVQDLFASHARETRVQHERLTGRLLQLGGKADDSEAGDNLSGFSALLHVAPQLSQRDHVGEERTLQNLISSYAVESGECALYEVLESVANAAGDVVTAQLAREIHSQERSTAQRIFHLIPSRAKIAFNVLTPAEIDPAVETRAPDDRLTES